MKTRYPLKLGEMLGFSEIKTYKSSNELILPETTIGIEVELEGLKNIKQYLSTHQAARNHAGTVYKANFGNNLWQVVRDGSLRNDGQEFVSSILFGQDLISALVDLQIFLNGLEPKPVCSERTSVHIHMGMADLSFEEFLYFICDYIVVEKLLFNYCKYDNMDRSDNFYCLPYMKCSDLYIVLNKIYNINNANSFQSLLLNECQKYSALNLKALYNYGTVEFRHHPGCYDASRIIQWINILMCIKKHCLGKVPENYPERFSGYQAHDYLKEIFGTYLMEKLLYDDFEKDMYKGIYYVQQFLGHHIMKQRFLELKKANKDKKIQGMDSWDLGVEATAPGVPLFSTLFKKQMLEKCAPITLGSIILNKSNEMKYIFNTQIENLEIEQLKFNKIAGLAPVERFAGAANGNHPNLEPAAAAGLRVEDYLILDAEPAGGRVPRVLPPLPDLRPRFYDEAGNGVPVPQGFGLAGIPAAEILDHWRVINEG